MAPARRTSVADELISRTTRGLFRDLMTGTTLGEIGAAFQDEGYAPNPYEDSSVWLWRLDLAPSGRLDLAPLGGVGGWFVTAWSRASGGVGGAGSGRRG